MRYSRPLDPIFHHTLKFVSRLTTRIAQQLLDVRHAVGLVFYKGYKIFVIERAGLRNEFFIMLTRPQIMTTMTECGALWHVVMQYMFAIG